jgi:hypothetical protein
MKKIPYLFISLLINNLRRRFYPMQSLFPRAARDKNIRQCKGSEKMGKFSNFLLRNFYYFCGVKLRKSARTLRRCPKGSANRGKIQVTKL